MDYRWVFTALFVAAVTGSFLPGITEAQNTTATPTMASNASTTASNASTTASNASTTASNASTTASNASTTATTTAAPLVFNDTVTTLNTAISNAECRKKQLCAAKPDGCDPSTTGSCYFLSAQLQSGLNYGFGLSGISKGYIAAILATTASPGNNEPTYICANNNSRIQFFSALLQSDGRLVKKELSVNSVKGSVDGDKIQCTFMATVPASARATATSLSMGVANGTYNNATGDLGPAISQFRTNLLDLSDPNATVTYTNSTATPIHAIALQQSLMQALLITVSVLGPAML